MKISPHHLSFKLQTAPITDQTHAMWRGQASNVQEQTSVEYKWTHRLTSLGEDAT